MNTHKKLLPVAPFTITLLWACTTYALRNFGLPALNAGRAAKGSVASQMIDHQKEMEALSKKLQASYADVLRARKDHNNDALDVAIREHHKNLQELRAAVREHELLSSDYKTMCESSPVAIKAMAEHQKSMKAALYDLVDSFDRVVAAHDHMGYPLQDMALTDHRAAMEEFEQSIEQHKQDIDTYAYSCQ